MLSICLYVFCSLEHLRPIHRAKIGNFGGPTRAESSFARGELRPDKKDVLEFLDRGFSVVRNLTTRSGPTMTRAGDRPGLELRRAATMEAQSGRTPQCVRRCRRSQNKRPLRTYALGGSSPNLVAKTVVSNTKACSRTWSADGARTLSGLFREPSCLSLCSRSWAFIVRHISRAGVCFANICTSMLAES